jgi:polysaccharide biosynthesis transport protein
MIHAVGVPVAHRRRAERPEVLGQKESDPLDLRRQIAIIRAWFPLLVASVVLAAGAAFVVSGMLPKVYEAKATLIVGQSLSAVSPDYNQLLVSQRLSTTYAAVATTRPTLETVIGQLGLGVTGDELSKHVRADAPLDSTLLTIVAQDADPARAAAIANALAQQLIVASPAIQGRQAEFQASIDADLKAAQDQIKATQTQVDTLAALPQRTATQNADLQTLEGRLVSLRSTYATLLSFSSGNASNLLSVIEPAVAPTAPVSPRPFLNTLLAAILGLLVAAGVAFTAEYLDDAVKDSDAVQEVAGLSTLGTVAQMKSERGRSEIYRLAALLYPRSGVAEAYRRLRTNIEFASVDAPIRTLLVTSSVPGEGKTTTAANLAVVFAQAGRRVLLVDADLRKPGIHVVFDLPNAHGLTTLLRSDEVSLDAIAHATEQENLRVLTTGPLPPNPAELLGSQRMRTVLDRLKTGEDLVIFDSPPLQVVTDSAILSSVLDGALLVIDAGHSRQGAVRQGRDTLARAGANVLGAVLNRIPARARSVYADYYGGVYGSEDGLEQRARNTEESAGRSTS